MADRNREIALTTLIDLFVQILFVIVLILAVKVGRTGAEGGFEITKPWQRLVEALGLQSAGRDVVAIAALKRIEALEKENKDFERSVSAAKERSFQKPFDGRAPGKPRCKTKNRLVPPVARFVLKPDGLIVTHPHTGWREIAQLPGLNDKLTIGFPLSSKQFSDRFSEVYALSEKLDCRYMAVIEFDPTISGEVLDRNSKLIQRFFYRAGS